MKRTPRNYDGAQPTGKQIRDLLPEMLAGLSQRVSDEPQRIVEAWPEIVGERIGVMTQAVSFDGGILKVRVKNSTLYSLLVEHERVRLVAAFQKKFPKVKFQNILFRIG